VTWLLVALGGAVGAVLRFWLTRWSVWQMGHSRIGTLFVNITGALILGVVVALLANTVDGERSTAAIRHSFAFFEIGLLGGFTTFSTFAIEVRTLLLTQPLRALGYVLASVLLSFLGLILGYILGGVLVYG